MTAPYETPGHPGRSRSTAWMRSRWTLPLFAVGLGLIFLAGQSVGGDPLGGVISLAIMVAVGALFLFGGRFDAIRQLRGDTQDERGAMIDLRATAAAGFVVIVAVLAGFVYQVARGEDPSPYAQIGAIGAVAYVTALLILRRRS